MRGIVSRAPNTRRTNPKWNALPFSTVGDEFECHVVLCLACTPNTSSNLWTLHARHNETMIAWDIHGANHDSVYRKGKESKEEGDIDDNDVDIEEQIQWYLYAYFTAEVVVSSKVSVVLTCVLRYGKIKGFLLFSHHLEINIICKSGWMAFKVSSDRVRRAWATS